MAASWIKLDSGEWGIRMQDSSYHEATWPGLPCTVESKGGKRTKVIVGEHVRTFRVKGGSMVFVFTVEKDVNERSAK
jgi:hypothetical protein